MNGLGLSRLFAYGVLGLPLAYAGLPLYVHVPQFYAEQMGLNLAVLGSLLLALRLCDAVIDPVIGALSDRYYAYTRRIMAGAVPVLMLGYVLVFNPPEWAHAHAALWLAGCLLLVYASFSVLMINYYALGVGMAEATHDHTRVAAFREGSMLVGVLFASVLPAVLLKHFAVKEAYFWFSVSLCPLLLVCAWVCIGSVRIRARPDGVSASFGSLLRSLEVRWVLGIGFCNAIPTAITSTLFLFYVKDVLQAEAQAGAMLAVYFLSAAAGMPLWARLSLKVGKRRCLMVAMTVAIVCFVWAWGLGAGDVGAFYAICTLTGLTLGADSMLMPSLLSDALADKPEAVASAFGLWNFMTKLTMAFAAGLALPILAAGGYVPGVENSMESLGRLSLCYGLLPCVFKIAAIGLLQRSPLDQKEKVYAY